MSQTDTADLDTQSRESRELMCVASFVFKDGKRPLAPEELRGILEASGKTLKLNKIYKLLDNPSHDEILRILSDISERGDEEKLVDRVGTLYERFLDTDEEAKSRRDILAGLSHRLPRWPKGLGKFIWRKREIRLEEALLIRAMFKYCRDSERESHTEDYVRKLAVSQIFDGIDSPSSRIFVLLQDKDSAQTKTLDGVLDQHRSFTVHFARIAHSMDKKFAEKSEIPEPSLEMPDTFQKDFESATTEMQSTSLTATAGSSNQRNEPGTGEVDIYKYIVDIHGSPQPTKSDIGEVDSDEEIDLPQRAKGPSPSSHGVSGNDPKGKGKEKEPNLFEMFTNMSPDASQPSEASPTPPRESGNDPKGKAKDKGGKRARESTPNTPGKSPASKGKESGGKKGKEPRRQ